MKSLLFHAVQPTNPNQTWEDFLFDADTLTLPEGAERLAQNVWLFPADDQTYRHLAQIGRQHGIETRCVAIVHGSAWQPLSPSH